MASPRKFYASGLLVGAAKLNSPRPLVDNSSKAHPVKYDSLKNKEYTPDKVEELLENYEEVPRVGWPDISIGTHLRYVKKDGEFKPGGFVRVKKHNQFILENVPFGSKAANPNYTQWSMYFDNINKIFVKDKNAVAQQSQPQPQPQQQPQPQPQMPMQTGGVINPMPVPMQTYNPIAQVETGFMQRQLDDMEKKINDSDARCKKLENDVAELTIFVKKIGKYIHNKGIDFDK
jgi:hypothetical protein